MPAGRLQLSRESSSLSSSASQSASSLEQTVATLEELTSAIAKNTEHSKEASTLSQESSQKGDRGEAEIARLNEAMGAIAEASKKIEDIINVIDDIAFQTNLLALNAAVEAARAGEQGRGFAVVAEAVRTLAQRSASAAKDITSIIKENVERTESGAQIAASSAQVLQSIVESIKRVTTLNGEIAASSAEQANGIGQISQSANELDRVTQQNAAVSGSVAEASKRLLAQSTTLESQISNLVEAIEGTSKHQETSKVRQSKNGSKNGSRSGKKEVPGDDDQDFAAVA